MNDQSKYKPEVPDSRYSRTAHNLASAFRRETKSSVRNSFYAQYAKESGYNAVSALFDACSMSERIHALRHAKSALFMGISVKIKIHPVRRESVPVLLDKMLTHEILADLNYPDLIVDALDEHFELAVLSFRFAMQTERIHIQLCHEAIDSPDYWRSESRQFQVCSLCGNTRTSGTGLCENCGAAFERFTIFEGHPN
ncbi:MAG: hypothetical protein Q4G59_00710 [Planctomycetia bacterium]|nr:hypothetical protein [Planctomycetia bacterium]